MNKNIFILVKSLETKNTGSQWLVLIFKKISSDHFQFWVNYPFNL